jgi:hypothetical protein
MKQTSARMEVLAVRFPPETIRRLPRHRSKFIRAAVDEKFARTGPQPSKEKST